MRAFPSALLAVLCAACSGAPPSNVVNDAYVETAASAAGSLALQLGKRGRLGPEGVRVLIGETDQYGAKTQRQGLTFAWRADDLDRVNWGAISSHGVLNLATPTVESKAGVQALGHWCAGDGGGQDLTPQLCGAPYQRAVQDFMARP